MSRYELVSGTSSKFWEIELRGSHLLVRWGRIGTAGQQQDKPFESGEAAAAEQARAIKRKLAEGYREVSTAATAKAPKPQSVAKPTKTATATSKPAKPTAATSKPAKPGKAAAKVAVDSADDPASAVALYAKMMDALEHSGVADTSKRARPAPVAASKLRAFEAKLGVELPDDFRAFLETHGPLAFDWKFRTDGGASYEFSGHDFSVGFPEADPFFDGVEYPDHRGIVWFAHADQNNKSWGFRCRAGNPATIVRRYLSDELTSETATFSAWLRDELACFGFKSELPKAARKVPIGEVASFATLAAALRHAAPKTAAAADLRTLCEDVDLKSDHVVLRFRERLPARPALPALSAKTTHVILQNAPEDLDLSSLAKLPSLSELRIYFAQRTTKTPPALAAFGAGLVLARVEVLAVTANALDDVAIGSGFPKLRELEVSANRSTLPADLAAIGATSISWTARQLVLPARVDVSPRLKQLIIEAEKATRIPELRGGKALARLDFKKARLGALDVSSLGNLPALSELDLTESGVTSIRGLDRLVKLRALYLNHNKLTELAGLETIAARLESLHLGGSAPRDLGFVAKLPARCDLTLSPSIGAKRKDELVAAHGKRLELDWF